MLYKCSRLYYGIENLSINLNLFRTLIIINPPHRQNNNIRTKALTITTRDTVLSNYLACARINTEQ